MSREKALECLKRREAGHDEDEDMEDLCRYYNPLDDVAEFSFRESAVRRLKQTPPELEFSASTDSFRGDILTFKINTQRKTLKVEHSTPGYAKYGTLGVTDEHIGRIEEVIFPGLIAVRKAKDVRNTRVMGARTGIPEDIEAKVGSFLTGIEGRSSKQQQDMLRQTARQHGVRGAKRRTRKRNLTRRARKSRKQRK
jgi:hypothetical protein